MNVIYKEPGKYAYVKEVKNFDEISELIGGMVQYVPIPNGLAFLCDGEAKIKINKPKPNVSLDFLVGNIILGPVIICSLNSKGDFASVEYKMRDEMIKLLNENSIV